MTLRHSAFPPIPAFSARRRRVDSRAARTELIGKHHARSWTMANVDGSWNTVTKSPMGDQQATLTVQSAGDSFSGSFSGGLGTTEIKDGKVSGDTLNFTIDITVPMPMTLTVEATVDGDTLTGTVGAGAFGGFPITGTRA
jgi:hypothetical protein